jgi:SOS response regulatory protein OraA/RecX
VETMARLGYVDDGRIAADRARNMVSRGFGDEAIRFDLEGRGIGAELIASAIEHLPPETERARAIVARSESDLKAARNLAAKGFSSEAIEAAVAIWPD